MVRIDTVSKIIKASPQTLYQAFIDPKAIAQWRPPKGMSCTIFDFNPTPGGSFRMAFKYDNPKHAVEGKTEEHADIFHGHFAEIIPNEKIVELVEFESHDPVVV